MQHHRLHLQYLKVVQQGVANSEYTSFEQGSQGNNKYPDALQPTSLGEFMDLLSEKRENHTAHHIYLCGPMTGFADYNKPLFNNIEQAIQAENMGGWPYTVVLNPAAHCLNYKMPKRTDYMYESLLDVVVLADFLFVFGDYKKSEGASLEVKVAKALGKPCYYLNAVTDSSSAVTDITIQDLNVYESDKNDTKVLICPELKENTLRNKTYASIWEECCRTPAPKKKSILEEAQELVCGPRGAKYGHPLEDFTRTADVLNALWKHRNIKLSALDVPVFMQAVKLSREMHAHQRDNLVDLAGYAQTLHMCYEKISTTPQDSSKTNIHPAN